MACVRQHSLTDTDFDSSAAAQLMLSRAWTWWEHSSSGDYNCQPLGSCDTIASFWQYFNNIPNPKSFFTSKASKRKLVGRRKIDSLSLFRQGVKPEWEDPLNTAGGEVLFRSDKLEVVNDMWYELVLALVGDALRLECGEIMGARVLDKSAKGKVEYRVELWYGEGVDSQALIEQLQGLLKPHLTCRNVAFSVRNHSSSLQKTIAKSNRKPSAQPKNTIKLPAPAPVEDSSNMRLIHVG